ncbi:MAG: hypothetical protein ABW218_10135 [Casimicrobiaceae bacterium]
MNTRALTTMSTFAVAFAASMPAIAGPSCSNATIRGTYMFTCEGLLSPAPGAPLLPTRSLGTCKSNKAGFVTCEGRVNLNGTILIQDLVGNSQTEADCTGDVHYDQKINGQPAGQLNAHYVVRDNGDSINGLPTDPGQVLSCTLKRLSHDDH